MATFSDLLNNSLLAKPYMNTNTFTSTDEFIHVIGAVNSTSTSTGSLTVAGGVGISNDVFANNLTLNSLTSGELVSTDPVTNKLITSGQYLTPQIYTSFFLGSPFSLPHGVTTIVQFDTAEVNKGITESNTNSRFTVTQPGQYLATFGVILNTNLHLGDYMSIAIIKNESAGSNDYKGVAVMTPSANGSLLGAVSSSATFTMVPGDYLEFVVDNAAAATDYQAGTSTEMTMTLISSA